MLLSLRNGLQIMLGDYYTFQGNVGIGWKNSFCGDGEFKGSEIDSNSAEYSVVIDSQGELYGI
ncbi:MAG: hypothetical protein QMD66_04930 [Actinomycetota bacterium]|nr:hypothetical protein [Actinomycetota bacterium]